VKGIEGSRGIGYVAEKKGKLGKGAG
jgi:hypothetical protein